MSYTGYGESHSVTQNDDMHEAGELREADGKKAVIGEARAPHDY
jgi:hypothetical protein